MMTFLAMWFCFGLAAVAALPASDGPQPLKERVANVKLKYATRNQVVARSRTQPAKRQTSSAPYPTCPNSPNQPGSGLVYATFPGTYTGGVRAKLQIHVES